MKRALLTLAALALFPSTAHAAFPAPSLTVDTAFAPLSGIAKDDFSSDLGSDITGGVAAFGAHIYTVGGTSLNNDSSTAVVAHLADGTLDPSFDGDGKLFLPLAPSAQPDRATAVVALPDGRLRLAVDVDVDTSSATNSDIGVVGLLPDGQLDTSFGGGTGKVIFPVRSENDSPTRITVDALGRLAVTGYTNNSNVKDTFVALLNPDGSPAAFGTNGVRVIDRSPAGNDQGADVAFLPGGDLAVLIKADTGSGACASPESAVIRGLQPDGSDDPNFGSGGEVALSVGAPTCGSALLEHGGRLWVTGTAFAGVQQDAFLARVNDDGSSLQSRMFEIRGKADAADTISSVGSDLAILSGPPESIVVVGSSLASSGSGSSQFAAAAFNNFDGDLAAAQYGDYVFSGSSQTGLQNVVPVGPILSRGRRSVLQLQRRLQLRHDAAAARLRQEVRRRGRCAGAARVEVRRAQGVSRDDQRHEQGAEELSRDPREACGAVHARARGDDSGARAGGHVHGGERADHDVVDPARRRRGEVLGEHSRGWGHDE